MGAYRRAKSGAGDTHSEGDAGASAFIEQRREGGTESALVNAAKPQHGCGVPSCPPACHCSCGLCAGGAIVAIRHRAQLSGLLTQHPPTQYRFVRELQEADELSLINRAR